MIKTTNYIVVFLTLMLIQTFGYAQYNGGSGDGAHTDQLSLTSCTNPPQFYAYSGGNADGGQTDIAMLTSCSIPSQYFAYMGGNSDGAVTDPVNYTSCTTPSQYFAYMGGSADGAVTYALSLTTCSAPAQFYAYAGGNADGAVADQLLLTSCSNPPQFYAYYGGSKDGFAIDSLVNCPTVPPVANFSASATTICVGSTVTFTDLSTNFPSAWNWTFVGGTPGTSAVQNPTITYNAPGVYNVTLQAANAHGANTLTMTGYITVNALPTANAGSDVSICNGSSATLNATGGGTYSWSPATGLSSATIANPVASPTSTTTYTVTVTTGGCSATDAVVVTVNPIPTANAGSDVAICNGSSTTLSSTGGGSYSWSPTTGLSNPLISNPSASPTITTTYTVTVTSAGCSATDAVVVTVNSLPPANAGSDVTICNGTSTTLSASGGTSYSWSPSTGLSSTIIANPIASPASTINYTVTVSNGTCSATDAVLVTVTPLPPANAGSDVTICNGSSATLNASGGTSYSWGPTAGLSSATIANPVANPTSTTNYTITVTASGCSATDVMTVTVNPIPLADAGTGASICNGSSASLSASGGSSYNWSPTTGLSNAFISNPSATPSATVTYTVTVSNGTCSATDTVTIFVKPLPTATISASGPTTFCSGDSVILTSSAGSSYAWSNSATTQAITVLANGSYFVTVTGANGCTATSASTGVTVNTTPPANISAGGPTTFCSGDSVTLTANSGAGYSWSNSAITQSITVMLGGTYSVSVSDINGCASSTASATVTVNPNPATPVITNGGSTALCIGDTVILYSPAATSYVWSTGSTSDSIIVTTAGSYSVTNYNSFGCSAVSSSTGVSVNDPLTDFTVDTTLVFIPTADVNFSATVNGVPPYTYLWNFGDATTSGSSAPSHTYGAIGYETVSLTLTDSTGCSKTITKPNYVEVEQLFPSWPMLTATAISLTGVSFIDAQTGLMSLSDGNCLISIDSGNTWSPLPTGNLEPLTGVSALPGNWFATGNNGTILFSTNNGLSWGTQPTGTLEKLNGSSFSSASNGFVVGTNGTIQIYNGTSWTAQTSGTLQHLNNVYAFPSGDAIAVGDGQTVLKYNGVSWLPQTSPLSFDIKDVMFTSPLVGYAAGYNGNIIQTTDGGTTWTPSLTGVDIDFNAVEASGPDTAWAAGTHGIVYRTIDNGTTWTRYSVGSTDTQDDLNYRGYVGHVVGQGGHGRNFDDGSGFTTGNTNVAVNPQNNFNVYPNPTKDVFTIAAEISSLENLTIEIKDANGKLIERVVNSNVLGQFTRTINTEHYRQGVYFIHFREGEKSWVKRLIIVK